MMKTKNLWHGTDARSAASIAVEGFKIGEVRWGRGWGRGLYLSRTPEFAAMWGDFLIMCRLEDGTRILWHRPHDQKVVSYLRKEFGADILKPEFHKTLPPNKQLKKIEIVHLWNYLLEKRYFSKSRIRNDPFRGLMDNYPYVYEQIRKYGYDGVGSRREDWPEMMIFNPSKIRVLGTFRVLVYPDERENIPGPLKLSGALTADDLVLLRSEIEGEASRSK